MREIVDPVFDALSEGRLFEKMPVRFDEADGKAFFNAAVFEIDLATKRTESVRAIQLF